MVCFIDHIVRFVAASIAGRDIAAAPCIKFRGSFRRCGSRREVKTTGSRRNVARPAQQVETLADLALAAKAPDAYTVRRSPAGTRRV